MQQHSPASAQAALLLTNRLVALDVKPMAAREFWELVDHVDPAELLAGTAEVDSRVRALLDAATAFGFAQERLHDTGIEMVSALDTRFPVQLRERLGHACPPWLLVAGPLDALTKPGLAILGSGDAGDAPSLAAQHGWTVITGMQRGVEPTIGVPSDGIRRVTRMADVRKRVLSGELTIVSPYAPDAPHTAANARARTTIVYGLSQIAFVTEPGADTGAAEALEHGYAAIGVRATPDHQSLIRAGAHPITSLDELFTLDRNPVAQPSQDPLF